MGKERFIEASKQFLGSIEEFVAKPKTILLGTVGIGMVFSGFGLSSGVVNRDETMITINSIVLVFDAGLVGIALKRKISKSVHQQSHPKNSPEL